jgi:hypothetical protein
MRKSVYSRSGMTRSKEREIALMEEIAADYREQERHDGGAAQRDLLEQAGEADGLKL